MIELKHDISPELYNLFLENFGTSTAMMLDIAYCESNLRHFNADGTVLMGRKTADVGILQISIKHWDKELKAQGIDYWTLEGNLRAAKYILDKQGVDAWVCNKYLRA